MTAPTDKAAPIPAEDAARILIAALREYGQEDNRAGEAENTGRHAAVRGMMVRLGLYPEFCKALDADATEEEVAALLADRASQEERIREEERARFPAKAAYARAMDVADRLIERAYGIDTPDEWNDAFRDVQRAVARADRARLRGVAS